MMNTLDHMFAARKSDLSVSFANAYEFDKIQKAVSNTAGVKRAEGWFTTEGTHGDLRFGVVALPPDTQLLEFDIIEGRKLTPRDTDAIVINNALAGREPAMRVGETVALRIGADEKAWRIVGISREAFESYASRLHAATGMVNSLRLALDNTDPDSISALKTELIEIWSNKVFERAAARQRAKAGSGSISIW